MIRHLFLAALIIILSGFSAQIYSQEILSIDEAIQLGLERNFGIQIAENEAEIDRINRTWGNAGFLPRVGLTGSREEVLESDRSTVDGVSGEWDDVEISLLSGDIELDWTLFDGAKMFINYRKLGEVRDLGETLSRIEVENTIADIIQAYYNIVRQEKLLGVLQNSVEISEERYNIAQTKRELGSGSEYELLLARSDLNTDMAESLRQEVVLNNSKLELIRLLDLESDYTFDVIDRIELDDGLVLDELLVRFAEENRQLQAANLRTNIANLEVREVRSERLPQLELNAGYTYNREEVRNNLLLIDRTDGFYIGVTARINIFDGFNTNRRVQSAKIERRNSEIFMQEQMKNLEINLYAEYENYSNSMRLIDLEMENLELATEALQIALEQFQLATITSLELRETQRIVFDTENRLIDAQFEAKLSETELLRLSGVLGN
ncbi:MAG: TolC family protein [Balneolaceae bacterium]|nr:TolC family protein [Balneolaceae bacterium]